MKKQKLVDLKVPQMGEGLCEVKLLSFLKNPGDFVKEDEIIYEMQTDKSVVAIESAHQGTLIKWTVNEGTVLKVGATLGLMEISGGISEVSTAMEASTLVKCSEQQLGLRKPVKNYREILLSPQQKTLIQRFKRSQEHIIPATLVSTIDMNKLHLMACTLVDQYFPSHASGFISEFHIFAYCVAQVCGYFPKFRSILTNDSRVREYENVNLGIAVQTQTGELLTTIISSANTLSFSEFITEIQDKIQKTTQEENTSEDIPHILLTYMGGRRGIISGNPILVEPSIAILFLGSSYLTENKLLANLSLTFDHRLINGMDAADFLQSISETIDKLSITNTNSQDEVQGLDAITEATDVLLNTQQVIVAEIAKILKSSTREIDIKKHFFEYGMDSIHLTILCNSINIYYGLGLTTATLFQHSTIQVLSSYLVENFRFILESQHQDIVSQQQKNTVNVNSSRGLSPLSFGQERLWLTHELDPHSNSYNIGIAVRIEGDLHQDLLFQALEIMIDRHESLRMVFPKIDGEPTIKIFPKRYIGRRIKNIIQPLSEIKKIVQQEFRQETDQAFDLAQGPLIRALLLNFNSNFHVFILVMPHIIADGWSFSILMKELVLCYNALANNKQLPFSKPINGYLNFIAQQREKIQGDTKVRLLQYWKNKLFDLSRLDLATDKSRGLDLAPSIESYEFFLPKGLSQKINRFVLKKNISLFNCLFSVFCIVLYRYSGKKNFSVAIPTYGREHDDLIEIVGFFVNILPIRVNISDTMLFSELVDQIKQTLGEALAYQDVPLTELINALNLPRDLNHESLFQTAFVLQQFNPLPQKFEKLRADILECEAGRLHCDVTLEVYSYFEDFKIIFKYNSNLYTKNHITRKMTSLWIDLLDKVIQEPNQRIDHLHLLPKEDLNLLSQINLTLQDYPSDKCLHQLFEEAVKAFPDKIAIVYEEEEISFSALNARANQVGHYLLSLGICPEVRVGVSLLRGIDLIVGLLGIFKAGGAYVPLDPTYPKERLDYMISDAGIKVLITSQEVKEMFSSYQGKVVCLDQPGIYRAQPRNNLVNTLHPDNLAYVVYTSGSTGKPKGVACSHRGVVNRLNWGWKTYPFKENETCCLQSSIGFVDSTWDIFGTLLVGARLVLYKTEISENIEALCSQCASSHITRITLVPSFLKELIRLAQTDKVLLNAFMQIKHLEVTGEFFDPNLVTKFRQLFGNDVTFLDCYGATEATSVIYKDFTHQQENLYQTIILSNTQIYILDPNLNPIPTGVLGEIYIGGVGLARGYFNRPELTAEKFIPNPFIDWENKPSGQDLRLYRTGDLARYLPDGNIEFFGRIDHQIKIRGFRVELAEVEYVLQSVSHVQQSVVVAREDSEGHKRLLGYVTAVNENIEGLAERCLRYCESQLPAYMIPNQIIVLEQLPLNANGKIDRKALPVPSSREGFKEQYEPPKSLMEKLLAKIWSDLFGIEQISRRDDFFHIGGHSLLATRLVSRLREAQKVEVPLKAIFQHSQLLSLASYLEQAHLSEGILPPITPVLNRDQLQSLSFAQQRLWFMEQLLPDTALYHVPLQWHIKGLLQTEALKYALDAVMERHEILRTSIITHQGVGYNQIGLTKTGFPLNEISLENLVETEQKIAITSCLKDEALKPFNFGKDPLCRALLLQLSPTEFILALTIHHIIFDGWSLNILCRELSSYYNNFVLNEQVSLPEQPIQYIDFSNWQRGWLQGDVLNQQLAYWKQQLEGVVNLDLPTDNPRQMKRNFQGGYYALQLSTELLSQLYALSQSKEVTLFMTLLAAFQGLLSRYTGQSDIAVGTPIANRRISGIEDLIGFFVNTLVLRAHCDGTLTFEELLKRVEETTLSAYSHQDVPFEQLVEHLQIQRDLSRHPLFQVMFILENKDTIPLHLKGLLVKPLQRIDGMPSKFDLTLHATENSQGLCLEFEYAQNLFHHDTIRRFASYIEMFLKAVVIQPNLRLSEIPLLPKSELDQFFHWNMTQQDYPEHQQIHQLFEATAATYPHNIAVIYEEQRLTYQQLNHQANQLAHYLRTLGVGPDSLVALGMDRSLHMVIGLLAILKAGGAYIPLDPTYPLERIQFILQDTKVPILLTHHSLKRLFCDYQGTIVTVDQEAHIVQQKPITNLNPLASSQHLAYVIYTSGSTGKPKGVQISHQGLVSFIIDMKKRIGLVKEDILLSPTSMLFDIFGLELYLPLAVGAKLILVPQKVTRDGEALLHMLQKEQVTIMQATSATWQMLLEAGWKGKSNFKILHGGEALTQKLKEAFLNLETTVRDDKVMQDFGLESLITEVEHSQMAKSTSVISDSSSKDCVNLSSPTAVSRLKLNLPCWNLYGPTETTIWSTAISISDSDPQGRSLIGKPIGNTQIYILDNALNRVPIGVTGEIYIGGVGLARGYLNRSDLTAEKFIPNPFVRKETNQSHPNLRLYRTGDLGRYLSDGNIEFLGRIDHQVKVRGFRIELGEIESTLAHHYAVSQAVVIAKEYETGNKKIIAYIVTQKQTLSSTELSEFVSKRLPDYMVPSFFVFLDQIPLTPNGKIDRQALQAKTSPSQQIKNEYVAPQTATEQQIASIWSEVLNIEKIGVYDHFFKIGGHSLFATQIISRIRHHYNIDIPLRAIFEHPTIAGLSHIVNIESNSLLIPSIISKPKQGLIHLSYAQQRLWFLDKLLPDMALYNIPIAMSLNGDLDRVALEKAFNALIERHESLRTCFPTVNGKAHQEILPHLSIDLLQSSVTIHSSNKIEQTSIVEKLARQEAAIPFDLFAGPLVRVKLLILSKEEYVLLITFHHIIADGWSLKIFFKELASLYHSYVQNKKPFLPPLTLQYTDFALWQRDWLQGKALEKQLNYWKQQLEGMPALLECPTDKPRPKELSYEGAFHQIRLSNEVKAKLSTLAHAQQASLFMTLLSIFQILLQQYSGQKEIVIGSPIANRHYKETENIIGLFVNTLVLRAHFGDNNTFIDLLNQVKETTLQAYQHQDVPFEQLVDHLNISRELNRNPIFQVMFTFQNAQEEIALVLDSLVITTLDLTHPIAKFDLTIQAIEDTEGLTITINYATDLFEKSTIISLANHFKKLTQEIVDNPQQLLNNLSVLKLEKLDPLLSCQYQQQALIPPLLNHIENECLVQKSTIEKILVSIWSELLKIDAVGIQDNFFKLGGDSIIIIQLVSKAREQGIIFAVKDVFNYPTIASLASIAKTEADIFNSEDKLKTRLFHSNEKAPSEFALINLDSIKDELKDILNDLGRL